MQAYGGPRCARDNLGEHVTVQIAERGELHILKVTPSRRVGERSIAWLEKNRPIWGNCKLAQNQLAVPSFGLLDSAAQRIVTGSKLSPDQAGLS